VVVAAATERGIIECVSTPQVEAKAALVEVKAVVVNVVVFLALMSTASRYAGKKKYEYISI
jgi:hypothetical protein